MTGQAAFPFLKGRFKSGSWSWASWRPPCFHSSKEDSREPARLPQRLFPLVSIPQRKIQEDERRWMREHGKIVSIPQRKIQEADTWGPFYPLSYPVSIPQRKIQELRRLSLMGRQGSFHSSKEDSRGETWYNGHVIGKDGFHSSKEDSRAVRHARPLTSRSVAHLQEMRKRKNESRQNIVAQKIEPLSRRCVGPLGVLRYRRSTNGKRLFMARALGAGTRRASAPRAERQGADDGRHEDPTHRHIPRALPTIRVSSCRDDLAFGWGDRPQRRSYYTIKSVLPRSTPMAPHDI